MALGRVRDAPFLLDALGAAQTLASVVALDSGTDSLRLLLATLDDDSDELTVIAAVHALGRIFDDAADAALSDLLSHHRAFVREHAAWVLGSRLPRLDAVGRLVAGVISGGFSGMLAQRTLERWTPSAPDHVALAVEGALATQQSPEVRARLVETLGLVPGPVAARAIRELVLDGGEHLQVRGTALSALGDRTGDPLAVPVVREIAQRDPDLADVARLAAWDLGLVRAAGAARQGLTIAQLFLHADIDRELSFAGAGDNGGVATLLVRLGDALAADPEVARVLTLSRGSAAAAADALELDGQGHLLAPVPLLPAPLDAAHAWPARIAAARGIRRVLNVHGPVDVLHLRMAEVGSMAASAVAASMGIPMVFTLAPDPHAVIHALDMTGALTRGNFGDVDEREHYWFRARLVQRLAANAAHTVLFPRPRLHDDLHELLGIDVTADAGRYTVVPEGIDLSVTEAAERDVAAGRQSAALDDLDALLAGLPQDRRGLPLAVSVGRLHRVKGMATVVEAWSMDPALRDRCNLMIVGGDLVRPSVDERDQLERIAAVVGDHPDGLLLAGHRRNDVVAQWLAVARLGRDPWIGAGGVYVCGSLKEEFGLALLEALAAGLPVVGPAAGGPATYVEDGVTGLLVDTGSPTSVAGGIRAALDLASGPNRDERAARARAVVRSRFTVQAMATTLADVYAGVTEFAAR